MPRFTLCFTFYVIVCIVVMIGVLTNYTCFIILCNVLIGLSVLCCLITDDDDAVFLFSFVYILYLYLMT